MGISISASSITESSAYLSASWSGYFPHVATGYSAVIECNGQQVTSISYSNSTSLGGSIGGLSANTTYSARVTLYHRDGVDSATTSFTTSSPAPTIYPAPIVNNAYVNGLNITFNVDSDYTNEFIYEVQATDGTYNDSGSYIPSNQSYSYIIVPYYSKTYRIRFKGGWTNTYWSSWYNFFTASEPITNPRPSNWAWSYNIYSGGSFYSYNATHVFLMPATEWNSFTARINSFTNYVNVRYGYSYPLTTFTNVSSGSNVTFSIINQAVNAINQMFDPYDRISWSVFDRIPAQIFIDMRNKLNSI